MTLRIEPATADRWDDLASLFGPNGAYSNCWCTWFMWRSATWSAATPAERRARLADDVIGGREPGLLAYAGDEPVGWCAVAPRDRYDRLTSPRARRFRAVDDRPSWVVTCFFVRRDRRGDGVASALLDAVASFVADRGGTLVEGYPVTTADGGPAAMYTGTIGMFERAGFEAVEGRVRHPVVRRDLR